MRTMIDQQLRENEIVLASSEITSEERATVEVENVALGMAFNRCLSVHRFISPVPMLRYPFTSPFDTSRWCV